MKKLISLYVLSAIVLLTSPNLYAEYGDMDPGTCAPSGIINKTKAKMNPKAFWKKMADNSARAIQIVSGNSLGDEWTGPHNHCLINNRIDSIGYQECMSQMRSTLDYWVRCNKHAVMMCRLNSGNC